MNPKSPLTLLRDALTEARDALVDATISTCNDYDAHVGRINTALAMTADASDQAPDMVVAKTPELALKAAETRMDAHFHGGGEYARTAPVVATVAVDRTSALIDAAEEYASVYDGDERNMTADVMNAFFAGSQFAAAPAAPIEEGQAVAWANRSELEHTKATGAALSVAGTQYGNRTVPLFEQAKPEPVERREVFAICDAYESGMGHGLQLDGHKSGAIFGNSECGKAYEIGYEEGEKRARSKNASRTKQSGAVDAAPEPAEAASDSVTISKAKLMQIARSIIAEELPDCDEEFMSARAHGVGSFHSEILSAGAVDADKGGE